MMSKQLGPVAASVESEIDMERNDNNTLKYRRKGTGNLMLSLVFLMAQLCGQAQAWGNGGSSNNDYSIYGNAAQRDWLYDGSTLSFQVLGCVWGVVYDSEEAGCLEDESEDGTYNWYMMANCRRPQVAYSVYSGNGCSSSSFVGSFVTTTGVAEFIYNLQEYDGNYNGDDAVDGDNVECYGGDNGYVGMGCSDGSFALNYYNDQYCMSRTGETYDSLNGVNNLMSNYKSCNTYKSNGDGDGSLIANLIYYSTPCMASDFSMCSNDAAFKERSQGISGSSGIPSWTSVSAAHHSWVTKLKYVIGGGFLLTSFIMFTGILFTNRRRRRAMMMRKYRQAKKAKRDKGREGSKSRKSRSSSKRRSKSKNREKTSDGVFT